MNSSQVKQLSRERRALDIVNEPDPTTLINCPAYFSGLAYFSLFKMDSFPGIQKAAS